MKSIIANLLEKSQKYTDTDNVYLAKYGSYLTIGNIISALAAFILSLVFARLLPKETYGQYRYLLSIFSLLSIASLQGMNPAIIQGVANGLEGSLKKGLAVKFKWSLLGSIVSIALAFYFLWFQGNIAFAVSFLIIAVFLPLFNCGEIFQYYLNGKKMFGQKVAYAAVTQVLATASMIITLFFTKNLLALVLTYFSAYSLLKIFFLFWVIKKTPPNKNYDPKIINYGKHLSLMGILGIIAQQIDQIMLFIFLGPAQLAIYSFASLPVEQMRTPLQSIQELALPKLAVKSEEEIKKTLPKKLIKSIAFVFILIIIYIIIVPYFFGIFYPQYAEAVPYSRVLALTLLVFPISMMMLSLQAKMKTKELYKLNIINPIAKIALCLILIPLYGIWGVVIALLLTQIFYFFLARHLFKKMA